MKKSDRDLGMDREITRRDFLNGVSVAVGAMIAPAAADAAEIVQQSAAVARTVDETTRRLTGCAAATTDQWTLRTRASKSFDAGEQLNGS